MIPVAKKLQNGTELVVRRAQAGDEHRFAEVSRLCYLETRFLSRCEEDECSSAESMREWIEEMEDAQKEIQLVALVDGLLVGNGSITACLDRKKMKHKCDVNVAVLKEYWHLGIGKTMMEVLMEFARGAGYEQVNLNVASDNLRAIRLYEYLGFEESGRELHAMKHADGDYSDFVFMTKFLI